MQTPDEILKQVFESYERQEGIQRRVQEFWASMSPEQQEKYRKEMESRIGKIPKTPEEFEAYLKEFNEQMKRLNLSHYGFKPFCDN